MFFFSSSSFLQSVRVRHRENAWIDNIYALICAGTVEEMESEEDDDHAHMVTIGDRQYAYHDVTNEMVAQMTPAEKEDYIRIGQAMYESYYE